MTIGQFVAWCVFIAGALVGPLIQFVVPVPSGDASESAQAFERFVHDVVYLLWPTQILGPLEYTLGFTLGLVVAVGANVLVYATFGAPIVLLSSHRVAFWLAVSALCLSAYLFVFAVWGGGLSLSSREILALLFAFCFFIALSLIARWIATRSLFQRHRA
jgi:hypothetical protein